MLFPNQCCAKQIHKRFQPLDIHGGLLLDLFFVVWSLIIKHPRDPGLDCFVGFLNTQLGALPVNFSNFEVRLTNGIVNHPLSLDKFILKPYLTVFLDGENIGGSASGLFEKY